MDVEFMPKVSHQPLHLIRIVLLSYLATCLHNKVLDQLLLLFLIEHIHEIILNL